MKKVSLILVVFFAIFLYSCNAKKEKKTDKNKPVTENIEENTEEFEYKKDDNVSTDVDTLDNTKTDDVDVNVDTTDTTENKEPVMEENEDGSVKKVAEKELKKEESKAVSIRVKKFYIIAGSFKNINNAVALKTFYQKKGFASLVLYPYHGYNRVAIGTYPNRAAAETDIKKVRERIVSYDGENIGYWLLWR